MRAKGPGQRPGPSSWTRTTRWLPTYPFAVHPPEYVAERLQEIDRDSAENLLLALTDDKCTLSSLERFTDSEKALRAMARTVLARYGDGTRCHTNVNRPGHARGTLDFTSSGWAYSPLSVYSEDYGLIGQRAGHPPPARPSGAAL
ncbi:hypothetical protein [Streptomyces sp. WM6372]|uniref:hypothetical protein n=1 Tax=Streptomyces sp. WM6372 TaxID=1415555 RepID=UPI000ADD5435|nr:hypothetical protein [Streptomyces sp. WM6372]